MFLCLTTWPPDFQERLMEQLLSTCLLAWRDAMLLGVVADSLGLTNQWLKTVGCRPQDHVGKKWPLVIPGWKKLFRKKNAGWFLWAHLFWQNVWPQATRQFGRLYLPPGVYAWKDPTGSLPQYLWRQQQLVQHHHHTIARPRLCIGYCCVVFAAIAWTCLMLHAPPKLVGVFCTTPKDTETCGASLPVTGEPGLSLVRAPRGLGVVGQHTSGGVKTMTSCSTPLWKQVLWQ